MQFETAFAVWYVIFECIVRSRDFEGKIQHTPRLVVAMEAQTEILYTQFFHQYINSKMCIIYHLYELQSYKYRDSIQLIHRVDAWIA